MIFPGKQDKEKPGTVLAIPGPPNEETLVHSSM